MRKTIIFLLIISITICIFADNIIFEEEKDTLEKKNAIAYIYDLEYKMGLADGKKIAKEDIVFFLIGMTILGIGPAFHYLYKKQYVPPETSYQKESIEYKLGFNTGYNVEKIKKNERSLMIGFFIIELIIMLFILRV